MVFKNNQPRAQEARAQLLLPPGGGVSRLRLWINDQPCEAAFSGREQVNRAYKEVAVVQRRDPVLVTTAGARRSHARCFDAASTSNS